MRALVSGDTVGGVFTYVVELATALGRRGADVVVALMGSPLTLEQRRALRDARVERVFANDFALEWMPEPWRDVERAGAWLLDIEQRVEPDVVHLNGYVHASLPWRAPVLVVGHSCVVSWHEAVRGREPGREWDRYRDEVRRGLAAASIVTAPTRAMLEALVRHYRPRAETAVIPNGRRALARPRRKEPYVLGAGRFWDEAKNLAALDDAAAALDWPVVVAGDAGANGNRPRHAIALGRVSEGELARRLARAPIFAAPALYEPFGLAALEAAHAGCALVLGDIPSLREVWGDAALYVDPRDHEQLVATLQRLTTSPDEIARCADAARERARAYTPARMADAYLDVYERLLTHGLERTAPRVETVA